MSGRCVRNTMARRIVKTARRPPRDANVCYSGRSSFPSGTKAVQVRGMQADSCQTRASAGRSHASLVESGPTSADTAPKAAACRSKSVQEDRSCARCHRTPVKVGPAPARSRPTFGEFGPTFSRTRPTLVGGTGRYGRFRPTLGRTWSVSGPS